MSAARNIPFENNVAAKNITIDSSFTPTPQGVILAVGQPVTFTNNSGALINSIQFPPNPLGPPLGDGPTLLTEITDLASGHTSPEQTPNAPNPAPGSVNYFIFDEDGIQYGPYSIQVGSSVPMVVQVAEVNGKVTYTPQVAAIPARGGLQMTGDNNYNVMWGAQGDPVSPSLLQIFRGGMKANAIHTSAKPPNEYPYGATLIPGRKVKGQSVGGGGGGKIIIRN